MTPYLFVYGTLQPAAAGDLGAQERARLKVSGSYHGRAVTSGVLLDFGTYPGMMPGSGTVHGGVYELSDPCATFIWLDGYEGISGNAGDEYIRRIVPVTLSSGRQVSAWAYVFKQEQRGWPVIATGRWQNGT